MPIESLKIRRAFLWAYGFGCALCVVCPVMLQGVLRRALTPGPGNGLTQDIGYTFTGLVALSALFVNQRSRRVRAGFTKLDEAKRVRTVVTETLLYSAVFGLSTIYGLIYEVMGGPLAERYARSFIALSTVMFLVFVPRLSAWRKAIKPVS